MEAGFPIRWYVTGWLPTRFHLEPFLADVVIAVGASLIGAKILKSVFEPRG